MVGLIIRMSNRFSHAEASRLVRHLLLFLSFFSCYRLFVIVPQYHFTRLFDIVLSFFSCWTLCYCSYISFYKRGKMCVILFDDIHCIISSTLLLVSYMIIIQNYTSTDYSDCSRAYTCMHGFMMVVIVKDKYHSWESTYTPRVNNLNKAHISTCSYRRLPTHIIVCHWHSAVGPH